LLKKSNPILFATAIDKIQIKKYGSSAYNIRPLGLQATIHRFAMYLERAINIESIIVDAEEYKKNKRIVQEIIIQLKISKK
jgi:hypothetical protein